MKILTQLKKLPVWVWAFFLNFTLAGFIVLYLMHRDGGYFLPLYDYSAGSIPYAMFINQSVKNHDFLWNWGIDLGGCFLESFGFYNLGSILSWPLLLLPAWMVPKAMSLLLIFKLGVSGASSAFYFKRHLSDPLVILLCSILYTFSGFQACSLVSLYFIDAIALFPLMPAALECLAEEGKKGRLLFIFAVSGLCNLMLFVAEAVFLLFYYLFFLLPPMLRELRPPMLRELRPPMLRELHPPMPGEKKMSAGQILKTTGLCLLECGIGTLAAGILLVPSIKAIAEHRFPAERIVGQYFFSVSTRELLEFIKAFFTMSESMNHYSGIVGSNWMSNQAYLPLFGMTLVTAYLLSGKGRLRRMLIWFLCCAVLPVMNSFFVLFDNGGYRRWYFMLILLMALATGKVLEKRDKFPIEAAALICLFLLAVYGGMALFGRWDTELYETDNLIIDHNRFVLLLALSAAGVVLTMVLCRFRRALCLSLCMVLTMAYSAFQFRLNVNGYQYIIDNSGIDFHSYGSFGRNVVDYLTDFTQGAEKNVLPYRYYFDEGIGYTYYNLAMTYSLPSINSFLSTAHPSVTDFYRSVGLERNNFTPKGDEALIDLLGARYIYSRDPSTQYTDYLGVAADDSGRKMYVYENENALPIGFTQDSYITRSEFDALESAYRAKAMLYCLVVPDEKEKTAASCLEHADLTSKSTFRQTAVSALAQERKAESCESVRWEDNTLTLTLTADAEKYAFLSIPYDISWYGVVNDKEAELLNSCGLMAVRLQEGVNKIELQYEYKPVMLGAACSYLGLFATAVYFAAGYAGRRKSSGDS